MRNEVYPIDTLVLGWLEARQSYAIWLVPLFAFAEACVGIGLFISGVLLLAIATFVLEYNLANVEWICVLAFFGALAGDHFGFYIGHWIGPGFHKSKLAMRYSKSISQGENITRKYGSVAIFIGRFVPAIRSLVPVLMGLSEFRRIRYSLLDTLACLLWATALGILATGLGSII